MYSHCRLRNSPSPPRRPGGAAGALHLQPTPTPCRPGRPTSRHRLSEDMTVGGAGARWLFFLLSCSLWLSNKY